MSKCSSIRSQFSEYLDGAITGVAMQEVAAHLESCRKCSAEFGRWRATQQMLAALGPAKAPEDMALRLRVAISQEKTHTPKRSLARWQVRWQNTVAPFLLQASAGLASAVLLIGTVGLLVGAVAVPETARAGDQPLGNASGPHFLYSAASTSSIGDRGNPVVVEAYVDGSGRVYDYQIVAGPTDPHTRSQVENQLLFSVFAPARFFGQPVRGLVVLSFAGVSVQG
ncbi:anti-sigma factor [Alloacidobacterium sp.]|uniref:anti-sigma factor n=1 Tax=Alloacidobacterium sp. TaxID=2951999 RepID=UPI002D7262A2|nr:zf-HC2 domain-containing protein [Alloacidobacterium sp.]HYK37911.1 zf-HC2 domain-containing protein [Alloacidobacterium sp.]